MNEISRDLSPAPLDIPPTIIPGVLYQGQTQEGGAQMEPED